MLMLSLMSFAAAQDELTFKPELEVRPRFEMHSGKDMTDGGGEVEFVTQRSRIGGTIGAGEVSVRVVLQDVRMWGEESNTLRDFNANNFDAHIAVLTWKPYRELSLDVGRQEIAIHGQRLIGAVGWTSQGRSFDGVRARWVMDGASVEAGGVVLAEEDVISGPHADPATMFFLRGGVSPSDTSTVDVLYILNSAAGGDVMMHTAGLYAKGASAPLSGRAEGYVQVGENQFAWMAGVRAAVAPDVTGRPKITLWYDHLSGDDDPADGDIKAFNTLFATNHKFYGHMDMVAFSLGGAVDGRGLQDAALKLSAKPTDDLSLNVDAHMFLASDPQGGDSALGNELDYWAGYPLARGLNLALGGAIFMPPDGAHMDYWGWLQLDAKFAKK